MLRWTGGDPNAIGVAPPVGQPEVSMEAAPPHPVDRPWLPSGTLVVPSSSQQISDPLVCQEPADTEQRSSLPHPFLISSSCSIRVARLAVSLRFPTTYPLPTFIPPADLTVNQLHIFPVRTIGIDRLIMDTRSVSTSFRGLF